MRPRRVRSASPRLRLNTREGEKTVTETIRINGARVAVAGSVAGIVHFGITGIVNGGILRVELQDWLRGAGSLAHPPTQAVSLGLWALMSLIYGVVGVWIYAGIRPRFGGGPKTALLAGLSLWIVSKLTVALDLIALGLVPGRIVVGQSIGGLVAVVLGVFLGAWLYRE
jgi:hypothetical protein